METLTLPDVQPERAALENMSGLAPVDLPRASAPLAPRQVAVVVDACCELDPSVVAELGIVVLPRVVRADGRKLQLAADRTLHASCWPQMPRRVLPEDQTFGLLAEVYNQVLRYGMSALALHPPASWDGATRVALAVRSILLAGPHARADLDGRSQPRVGVYEAALAGRSFAFLAEAAARGAAEGLALHQIVTLLDQMQAALRSVYVTGAHGPAAHLRRPSGRFGGSLFGGVQAWMVDAGQGVFVRQAGGGQLAPELFGPSGPLAGATPIATCTPAGEALLRRLNEGRAQMRLEPLQPLPGGLSLAPLFPHGCVELAVLPELAHVARIGEVIRRIDRHTTAPVYGVRQRGGF